MKTRKIYAFIALLILLCCWGGVIGCGNFGGGNDEDGDTVEAGWYKYTSTIGTVSSTTYLYINSNGNIERVGNDELGEFSEDDSTVKESLQRFKNTMNYNICRDSANNSNGMTTFVKCDTPSWANGDEPPSPDDNEGQQLDEKHITVKVGTITSLSDLTDKTFNDEGFGWSIKSGFYICEYVDSLNGFRWKDDGNVEIWIYENIDRDYTVYIFTIER